MRNVTLVGATLGGYPRDVMRRMDGEAQAALLDLLRAGRYRPLVTEVVDFADVPAAVTRLAARETMGRVVVRVGT